MVPAREGLHEGGRYHEIDLGDFRIQARSRLEKLSNAVLLNKQLTEHYVYPGPPVGAGQSSSVMLDQNFQIVPTARRVKRISKRPPFILPFVELQMCTLITYWKIWPIAKRRAARMRYSIGLLSPNIRVTRKASRRKNSTRKTRGMSR